MTLEVECSECTDNTGAAGWAVFEYKASTAEMSCKKDVAAVTIGDGANDVLVTKVVDTGTVTGSGM